MFKLRERIELTIFQRHVGARIYAKPFKKDGGYWMGECVAVGGATPLFETIDGDNEMGIYSHAGDDAEQFSSVDLRPGMSVEEIVEKIAAAVEAHPFLADIAGDLR